MSLKNILGSDDVMSQIVRLRKRFAKAADCAAKRDGMRLLRDAVRSNDNGFKDAAMIHIVAAQSKLRDAEVSALGLRV